VQLTALGERKARQRATQNPADGKAPAARKAYTCPEHMVETSLGSDLQMIVRPEVEGGLLFVQSRTTGAEL
jgi:hypothetical protein